MSLPEPRPGLVINYSYLWTNEFSRGREEGIKDRPSVIVLIRRIIEGRAVVTVVPVTHTAPADERDAVELPASLKRHLGLDDHRSWVIVAETNEFLWPGPDLRHVPGNTPRKFEYGMLPPRFFALVRDQLLEAYRRRSVGQVVRTE